MNNETFIRIPNDKPLTKYFQVEAELYDDLQGKQDCQGDPDYSYKKCVDDQIAADLLPKLGCIPPYLSDNNQCTTVKQESTTSNHLLWNFMTPYYYFMKSKAQETCKTPCKYQIFKITEGEETYVFANDSWINVIFNQKVKKFTKLPNYNIFR